MSSDQAWSEIVERYEPLVYSWLRPRTTSECRFGEKLVDARSVRPQTADEDDRRRVLAECLRDVVREVAPTTLVAFRRQVLDGIPAERVADELGITVGAAYSAKSRVLRKLRQRALSRPSRLACPTGT